MMNRIRNWTYPIAVLVGWLALATLTLGELNTLPRALALSAQHQART